MSGRAMEVPSRYTPSYSELALQYGSGTARFTDQRAGPLTAALPSTGRAQPFATKVNCQATPSMEDPKSISEAD
jgi:hypothetical protein